MNDPFERPAWQASALCRGSDPELFYPEKMEGGGTYTARRARHFCLSCPVRLECLEAGMEERHGIWGGLTYKERCALKRRAA